MYHNADYFTGDKKRNQAKQLDRSVYIHIKVKIYEVPQEGLDQSIIFIGS